MGRWKGAGWGDTHWRHNRGLFFVLRLTPWGHGWGWEERWDFLAKAAAVKSLRTIVVRQRCKRRVRLQAVPGKSGGLGEGCPRCRDCPCVSLYTDQRSDLVLSTCAQVTSDSSQWHRSRHPPQLSPSFLPTLPRNSLPCLRLGFRAEAEAQLVFPVLHCCRSSRGNCSRGTGASEQAPASPGQSHWACSVAPAGRGLGARTAVITSAPSLLPCPAQPSSSLPRRGPARLAPPLGLARRLGSRRGGGGGGQAGERWCGGTLCALRQDTRSGAGTRLRSVLSSRKLQPWWKFESWAAARRGRAQAREMRDGGGRGPEPLSAPVSSRGGSALGEPAGRRRRQRRRFSPPLRLLF